MAARFWVGGTGTWDASSTTNWSASTGGAGGASVPTPSDAVTIDASSGSGTITVNTNFSIGLFTFGAMNMTLDFSVNNNSPIINGANFAGGGTRTINMGNGVWTSTGTTLTANNFTNCTLNQGNSSIVFTNTSASTLTLSLTSIPAYWNKFTFNRGASTGTIAINMGTSGGGVNTFIDNGTAVHLITFQQNRNSYVDNFQINGSSAGSPVTLGSNGAGIANLVKITSGIINFDYIGGNGTPLNVSPANTWYYSANSSAPGGTGWNATMPARKLGAAGAG
jgi:hypothetical protein